MSGELLHTAPMTEGCTSLCAPRVTHNIALPLGEKSHLCASAMRYVTPASSNAEQSTGI